MVLVVGKFHIHLEVYPDVLLLKEQMLLLFGQFSTMVFLVGLQEAAFYLIQVRLLLDQILQR